MSILDIILIILSIIFLIGIIRVIVNPRDSFGEMMMDIFFLDLIGDAMENIGDAFDNDVDIDD